MYSYINHKDLCIDTVCFEKLKRLYPLYMYHRFDLLGSGFVQVGYHTQKATGEEDLYELPGKGGTGDYHAHGLIVKYGPDGALQWIDNIAGPKSMAELFGITAVEDGYVVVGYARDRSGKGFDGDLEGLEMGPTGWAGLLVKYSFQGKRGACFLCDI